LARHGKESIVSTFFGLKDFSLKNVYSISTFEETFSFIPGDLVVFFKSPIENPGTLITPKGALKDLTVAAVRKVKDNGSITSVLVPMGLDAITLAKDMVTKGPEAPDRTLFVNDIEVIEDMDLTKLIKSPVFTYRDGENKFILRTLDVLRLGTGEEENGPQRV
jgi:hypothetical protein